MSIVVNPHTPEEELALLKFLDSMKIEYQRDKDFVLLSDEKQQEILERDRQYEAGEIPVLSLNEVLFISTSKRVEIPFANS